MGIAAYVSTGALLERRAVDHLSLVASQRRDALVDLLRASRASPDLHEDTVSGMVATVASSEGESLLWETMSIGSSAEMFLAFRNTDHTLTFIHHADAKILTEQMSLPEASARFSGTEAAVQGLYGADGMHTGKEFFSAFRAIPGMQATLVLSIPRSAARTGIEAFSIFLAGVTAFILGAASILSVLFAHGITRSIHSLLRKVGKLSPGHWAFPRTIRTGDEVELLDAVVADLTLRLRDTFGAMEGEIVARTSALKKQFMQDRAILETIEHGVILFDVAGNITGANPAAERLLCVRSGSLLKKDIAECLPLRTHRKTFVGSQHPVARCLAKHQRFHQRPDTHLCVVRTDRTLLPIQLVVSPILERGKCTGGLAVFQDVTEERQLDYMKSEFISLASHQLRTPLSAILWYIELLEEKKGTQLNTEQRSYIHEMHTSAQRMSGLIDALLQVSRLEGGGIRPTQKTVDLEQFLRDIAEESKALAKDSSIALALRTSGRSVKVKTDAMLLAVVMQNILSNAVKYSKDGGQITISLQTVRGFAEIIVEDNGIGIPKSEQQHLFQKLFRANNVHKVDATGSGLGLYISKMVMETLGGSVSLKSKEGKGTTVTVRLPVK